jgi:hypothetical protein
MVPNVLFYQLLVITLVVICLLIHVWWPDAPSASPPTVRTPDTPRRKRSTAPKPFPGFLDKPLCAACEQGVDERPTAPGAPPPVIACTRGRRRTVDTRSHFCPDPDGAYRGWLGCGNIRSNGHPGGQPWRQLQCVSCHSYFYETRGTIFHGKRSSPELIVRVLACLAEGLGIRGTARVLGIFAQLPSCRAPHEGGMPSPRSCRVDPLHLSADQCSQRVPFHPPRHDPAMRCFCFSRHPVRKRSSACLNTPLFGQT